ncbi:signal peptidase [Limtongia smithiae]|uniref:signal peptidase n=1 Tax=Limtongia smithiae TaxID=1125753 RepID=UPI0034CEAFDB
MFSTFQRLQQYCGLVTTALIFLCAAISIASQIQDRYFTPLPSAFLNIQDIELRYGKPPMGFNYKRQEYALTSFDLDADLTPLFNWNTKQIFVYLAATYPGRPYANKVVLWDAIITDRENAILSLKNETADYAVYDVTGKFNERSASLSLEWNVQPYVGLLTLGKSKERSKFTFPPLKSR